MPSLCLVCVAIVDSVHHNEIHNWAVRFSYHSLLFTGPYVRVLRYRSCEPQSLSAAISAVGDRCLCSCSMNTEVFLYSSKFNYVCSCRTHSWCCCRRTQLILLWYNLDNHVVESLYCRRFSRSIILDAKIWCYIDTFSVDRICHSYSSIYSHPFSS